MSSHLLNNRSPFKFLWQCIQPYTWYALFTCALPLLSALSWPLFNYATKLIIDSLADLTALSWSKLYGALGLLLAVEIGLNLLYRGMEIMEYKREPLIQKKIVTRTYNYLQYHDYAFFQNEKTGNLSSKVQQIVTSYRGLRSAIKGGLLYCLLQLATNSSVLWMVHYRLGLLAYGWLLFYLFMAYGLAKRLADLGHQEATASSGTLGYVSDCLSNITSVMAFGAQRQEAAALCVHINKALVPKQRKKRKCAIMLYSCIGLITILFGSSSFFYAIYMRVQGRITIGDLTFVSASLLTCVNFMWSLSTHIGSFIGNVGILKSAFKPLQRPHGHKDTPYAKAHLIAKGAIVFRNIHFAYEKGQPPVLQNFSLTIKAGEKIGIVGGSGEGKSTLVHLLLRYMTPQQGTITIDGQDLKAFTQESLRKQIAFIPQDTMLFHRTIRENIAYAKQEATQADLICASRQAKIHEVILSLPQKYDTLVGERGIKLSGGQRQRIAIARAFLKKAPILILDEATSALDSVTEAAIQESLDKLIQHQSVTVLAIAHRLSTLRNMDRIVVLKQGKILESGPHEILMERKGYYYRHWQQQKGVRLDASVSNSL